MSGPAGEARTIPIRDASIRLGQLLKLADLVDDGSEARAVIAEGLVEVNGEVETRRGRQLVPGDLVKLAGHTVGITTAGH